MGRPKLQDRVTLTVRISPKIMQQIDAAVTTLQDAGESSLTKGALVERMLMFSLMQMEEDKRSKKQMRLPV